VNKRLLSVFVAWLTCGLAIAGAQSATSLENAKALYNSASFDEALTVLDRLGTAQPDADVEEVQRYRALCLLALNRTAEAQNAIEVVFSRDPLYRLAEGDAPPRMRAAFNEVRRRLLPKVTEQLYASAKLSFDRKEYALAATQFKDLLTFLEDADAKSLPSLKEFRTLATGFRDLSVAAAPSVVSIKPDPAPSAAAPPAALPPAAAVAESAGKTASKPVIAPQESPAPSPSVGVSVAAAAPASGAAAAPASAASPGVLVPPVILRQQMPLWLAMKELLPRGKRGQVRVIIDDQGNVEEARVVESVHPVYDALLLSAARTWKYEPATLDGKPVRYVKLIEIVLKPTS
jgi:periplasmic protein TonB